MDRHGSFNDLSDSRHHASGGAIQGGDRKGKDGMERDRRGWEWQAAFDADNSTKEQAS